LSVILYSPAIGPVEVEVILKESHSSALGITELPIETGAKITDHAYVEPKKLELEFADCDAADTYMELVRFQEKREPFDILTGLFKYESMLIKDLRAEREQTTSRILKGSALLQEVILVSTAKSQDRDYGGGSEDAQGSGKPKDQETKDRTDGTKDRGDQPTKPNTSILKRHLNPNPAPPDPALGGAPT